MVGHAGQEEARRFRVECHQLAFSGHHRDPSNQVIELILLFFLDNLLAGSTDGEMVRFPPGQGLAAKISQGLEEPAAKHASGLRGARLGFPQFLFERILYVFIHKRAQFLPDVAVVVLRLPDELQGPLLRLVHRGEAEITWHFSQEFSQVK